MKTPQQIRNEVEKGCGIFLYEDEFGDKDDLFNHDVNCGTYLVRDNKLVLCPSCQAKLSILTEYDKAIKEMIEDLLKGFRTQIGYRIIHENNEDRELFSFNSLIIFFDIHNRKRT